MDFLNFLFSKEFLLQEPMMQVLYPLITGFVVAFVAVPSLIRVAKEKRLQDDPDHRKKHSGSIPTLGGVAIFAGIICSYTFWCDDSDFVFFKYTLISILILFFSGIKDDLITLSVRSRIIIHTGAILIVILFGQARITNLGGIFGIDEIPALTSYILTLFIIFAITNSINLVDGIDGLASGLAFIASAVISTWFFIRGDYTTYAVLGFSMCGALLGFMIYNFQPAKVFMGDTGALIIGFLVAVIVVKFIDLNVYLETAFPTPDLPINIFKISSSPAVAFAIVMVPVFDVMRVMVVRFLNGKSMFRPDRSHVHHLLVDILGFSHAKACIILYVATIGFIIEAYYLQKLGSVQLILVLIATGTVLSIGLWAISRRALKQKMVS